MILLPASNYILVEDMVRQVPFNTYFARMVTGGGLPGAVYADNINRPSAALVAHPYGMSLLVGETSNQNFNRCLVDYLLHRPRKRPEWLQAYPDAWNSTIRNLLGDRLMVGGEKASPSSNSTVIEQVRVNFTFDKAKFQKYLEGAGHPHPGIIPTTTELFDAIDGQVVPKHFWRDSSHFVQQGKGFSLVESGKPVSTAFSAFAFPGILELGIETGPEHRGKGYAEFVCRRLIEHCIQNGLEPVWSCRKDNIGSFQLAQKLGFRPSRHIPMFYLAPG